MEIETSCDTKFTRSKSNATIYKKELCVICQKDGGKLRKVEFLQTGKKMYEVAKVLPNKEFFIRLSTIPQAEDAVANDVAYHLKCWVLAQREVQKELLIPNETEIQELEDVNRVIADIEIIDIVRRNASVSKITDMNTINETYNNLLGNNTTVNYKRYLKSLLQSNISDLIFEIPSAET